MMFIQNWPGIVIRVYPKSLCEPIAALPLAQSPKQSLCHRHHFVMYHCGLPDLAPHLDAVLYNTGARRSRRWRRLAVWGMMSSTVLNGPTHLPDNSGLRMWDFMLSHACSHSIPSSSPFSSPSVIYLITGKREGRKRIQVTVMFSLTPPLCLTRHRFHPLSQNSNLSLFFFPHSVSFGHKSKAWICSALFCNPQLASSIGDCAAGNCLCAVLAPHFSFWIIYILGPVFYFCGKSGKTLMLWCIR